MYHEGHDSKSGSQLSKPWAYLIYFEQAHLNFKWNIYKYIEPVANSMEVTTVDVM